MAFLGRDMGFSQCLLDYYIIMYMLRISVSFFYGIIIK